MVLEACLAALPALPAGAPFQPLQQALDLLLPVELLHGLYTVGAVALYAVGAELPVEASYSPLQVSLLNSSQVDNL